MIGARAFIAISWILTIFWACVSDSEPPNTVKSLAKTNVLRPLTVPHPVTTPSPGILVLSMPNSEERCSTNMSNSSKEPLSSRSSMRSRAVSLPRACCASMRFSPPPSLAPARRSSRVSRMSFICSRPAFPVGFQGVLACPFRPRKGYKAVRKRWARAGAERNGENNERDHRAHRRRDRRTQNPAAARRAGAVCSHGGAVRTLGRGRPVVAYRRAVPRARSQFRGLSRRATHRRDCLQRRAFHPRAGGADDVWFYIRRPRNPARRHRHDLACAYRNRPRARLRIEIRERVYLHPSRPHRKGRKNRLKSCGLPQFGPTVIC